MMAALDLLGRRWMLRVIWELQQEQPLGFRELRRRADEMSSSVLTERLGTLVDVGVIGTDSDGRYRLTLLGERLAPSLEPLADWAAEWARQLDTAR